MPKPPGSATLASSARGGLKWDITVVTRSERAVPVFKTDWVQTPGARQRNMAEAELGRLLWMRWETQTPFRYKYLTDAEKARVATTCRVEMLEVTTHHLLFGYFQKRWIRDVTELGLRERILWAMGWNQPHTVIDKPHVEFVCALLGYHVRKRDMVRRYL